jgi:hypothetical protein
MVKYKRLGAISVKELIDALSKFHEDARVWVKDDHWGCAVEVVGGWRKVK